MVTKLNHLSPDVWQKNKLRVVLDEETQSTKTRWDALYSFGDAFMEAFVSGKGPLGPVGIFGLWFGILVGAAIAQPYLRGTYS